MGITILKEQCYSAKEQNMEQPYLGIEESLKYLVSQVGEMKKEIIDLKTRMELKAYSLREIAEGLGCSLYTLRSRPWKIPNYGKPDVGINPSKWFYKTIMNWYAIPEDERRFTWESMTSHERRKAMGKAS